MVRESAGGIVRTSDGRIVLVCQHNNSWSFPKGGVEEGEDLLSAAVREIQEETGIKNMSLVAKLGTYERFSIAKDGMGENEEYGKRKRTIFLFDITDSDFSPRDPDKEITDVRLVTIDEAISLLTHPKDKEFLRSVRATIEQ